MKIGVTHLVSMTSFGLAVLAAFWNYVRRRDPSDLAMDQVPRFQLLTFFLGVITMKGFRGLIIAGFGLLCVFSLNGQAFAGLDENNYYNGGEFLKAIEKLPYDERAFLAKVLGSDQPEAKSLIKRFYKFSMSFLEYKTTKSSKMSYGMAIDSIINELKIDSASSGTMAYKEAIIRKYMLDMLNKVYMDTNGSLIIEEDPFKIWKIFFAEQNITNDNEYKRAAMFVAMFSGRRMLWD